MSTVLITLVLYFLFAFTVGTVKKNHGLVDIAWGMGFVVSGLAALLTHEITPVKLLGFSMMLIWGLRLSIYLFIRNWGKTEDKRYTDMRKRWVKHPYLYSFLNVYALQGVLLFLINQPYYQLAFLTDPQLSLVSYVAIFFWVIGFIFEVLGDKQLSDFRKNPDNKGKLITSGLWSITRHPNYFGEALMWWSMAAYSVSVGAPIAVLLSALLITLFLRYVSGVPLLEKKYKDREDFKIYAKNTSVFIPWFKGNNK